MTTPFVVFQCPYLRVVTGPDAHSYRLCDLLSVPLPEDFQDVCRYPVNAWCCCISCLGQQRADKVSNDLLQCLTTRRWLVPSWRSLREVPFEDCCLPLILTLCNVALLIYQCLSSPVKSECSIVRCCPHLPPLCLLLELVPAFLFGLANGLWQVASSILYMPYTCQPSSDPPQLLL